jgi:hypothetical protein
MCRPWLHRQLTSRPKQESDIFVGSGGRGRQKLA